MNRYGLIFVLYQPTGEFLQNLAKAHAFCPNMVAVDNSPEADLRLHECLREQGIQVIFNRNNGGLAGAYNRGAEALLERRCEVIFLLDQDSDIEALFFEKMMQACRELDTDEFLVGPKIYEVNLEGCMPVFQPGKYIPKRLLIDDRNEGMFPTLFLMSSGSAISAAAYRKLGAFREDYFIQYVDIEYSLRAVSQNVSVYMNAAVTMRQTVGKIERHGNKFTTNHVAWRRYYDVRNAVHCMYLHRASCGRYCHLVSGQLSFLQAVSVLQYEPQKLKKITAIACGYLDGVLRRLGTFEDRHPRIAAFCKRNEPRQIVTDNSSPVTLSGGEA